MLYPPPLQELIRGVRVHGDSIICSRQALASILYVFLLKFPVDEEWYRQTYPDVDEAIKAGTVDSAAEHFRTTGYLEGRLPFALEVDDAWYLERYPDVADAVKSGSVSSAQEHFITMGYREGRLPRFTPVDGEWYVAEYPQASERIKKGLSRDPTDDFLRYGYQQGFRPHRSSLEMA